MAENHLGVLAIQASCGNYVYLCRRRWYGFGAEEGGDGLGRNIQYILKAHS